MTRLIDADALKKFINSTIASATKVGIVADADYLWELLNYAIDEAPTVEERPKGEWKILDAEGEIVWNCVCSECGHDPQEHIGGTENWWLRKTHLPNFCPNCGADMRGGHT